MTDPKLASVLRREDSWKGQRVVVLGLGRSGKAACRLLAHEGAEIHAVDDRPASELQEVLGEFDAHVRQWSLQAADRPDLDEAVAVVVSPGVGPHHPWLRHAGSRELPVIGEMELASRRIEVPLFAVTGTNGKSTTVSLVHRMLEVAGVSARLAGNIGFALADQALDLGDARAVVVEVSSFQLERIAEFHPRVAAILNVAPDHLDRYDSVEDYAAAKRRIFENLTPEDFAVVPAADPRLLAWAEQTSATVAPFSTGGIEGTWGSGVRDGIVVLRREGRELPILEVDEIPLVGDHNLRNVLAALAITLAFELEPAELREAIRSFEPLPHRAITVPTDDGVRWIDDSKATNVHAALATVAGLPAPVIWLLGGRGKGEDYRPLTGPGESLRRVLCFGEEGPSIADVFEGHAAVETMGGLESALERAGELAQGGDTVVLSPACASFDEFTSFAQRGEFFQDWVRRRRGGRA